LLHDRQSGGVRLKRASLEERLAASAIEAETGRGMAADIARVSQPEWERSAQCEAAEQSRAGREWVGGGACPRR